MRPLIAVATLAALISSTVAFAEPKEGSSEKRICKKFVETGSLVKARKVCKTYSQWEKERTTARETGRDMQTSGSRIAGSGG